MGILKKLLARGIKRSVETPPPGRSVFCSGCFQVVPESSVNVIPWCNDELDKFVTTYRCEACWMEALNDTLMRLAFTEDESLIASAMQFFEAHGVVLLEYRRGDPPAAVRALLLDLLGRLRSGSLTLSIGETTALYG